MAVERVLSNLNLISFKTEGGLQNHIDELQDGDLVFTPDNSLKGTLLDFKWADHLLNDMSWLRADTFSWQSGDVYVAAYNHLVTDFEGAELKRYYAWVSDSGYIYYSDIENVTNGRVAYMYNNGKFTFDPYIYFNVSDGAVSVGTVNVTRDASKDKDSIVNSNDDTFGDTTITYYRAEDGHKICLPDQEDKILELYNKTGVAWYYILDTANKQFKLPRTKFGFTGLRDEVGGYVEAGLPDHTHTLKGLWRYNGGNNNSLGDGGENTTVAKLQDAIMPASENNPIYGNSNTVQPPATQMYLYFYVGCFDKEGIEQTAGITAETFNNKADVDLSNMNASQSAKNTIVGWGMPDYTAGVSVANNTVISGFTAPEKGILMLGGGAHYPKINGIDLANGSYYMPGDVRFGQPVPIQLDKGDTFSCQSYFVGSTCTNVFYPFKGVN